jgi:hypothetical protein
MQAMDWEDGRNIRFLFVFTEGSNEHAPELIAGLPILGEVKGQVQSGGLQIRRGHRLGSISKLN